MSKLSCRWWIVESSSLVGVTADYPQYRPREGIVFTLEDRINGCMIRSMNGEMIENDSEEMRAMIAYFNDLSHGVDGSRTGANSGPALWGENSFNDGAGMGR